MTGNPKVTSARFQADSDDACQKSASRRSPPNPFLANRVNSDRSLDTSAFVDSFRFADHPRNYVIWHCERYGDYAPIRALPELRDIRKKCGVHRLRTIIDLRAMPRLCRFCFCVMI